MQYASAARVLNRTTLRTGTTAVVIGRWRATLRLAAEATRTGGPPLLLIVIALGFLAAQDRIDRNDPKLALAPVHGHQELVFKPIDRGTA